MATMGSFMSRPFQTAKETLSKIAQFSEHSDKHPQLSKVFHVLPLSSIEKDAVSTILERHKKSKEEIGDDLEKLSLITAEIKAISAQAAVLHGERIKKAQTLLKKYRDGAFSAWLIAAYGNRQTPYNFLQYYELHREAPKALVQKLQQMPKQVAYVLASRTARIEQKLEFIAKYEGKESKEEMLRSIRTAFPLSIGDKRAHDPMKKVIEALERIHKQLESIEMMPSAPQVEELKKIILEIQESKYLKNN